VFCWFWTWWFSLYGFEFEYAITVEHLHLAELGLKGVEQDCGVEVGVRCVLTDDAVVVYSDCVHGDFSLRKEKGDRSRPVGFGSGEPN
jgi:hypothetical protein